MTRSKRLKIAHWLLANGCLVGLFAMQQVFGWKPMFLAFAITIGAFCAGIVDAKRA